MMINKFLIYASVGSLVLVAILEVVRYRNKMKGRFEMLTYIPGEGIEGVDCVLIDTDYQRDQSYIVAKEFDGWVSWDQLAKNKRGDYEALQDRIDEVLLSYDEVDYE